MIELRQRAAMRDERRTFTMWFFAALVVALLVVCPLSRSASTTDNDGPQAEAFDRSHAHVVASRTMAPALPSVGSYLRRAASCPIRLCAETGSSRTLISAFALALIAWRRYAAGRREPRRASTHHPGSIFFLRGPPACSSRYTSAVAAGDQPMNTTREDWLRAIRYRIDALSSLRARIII